MILNKFFSFILHFLEELGSGLHSGDGATLSKIFQVIMGGISDEMRELDSYFFLKKEKTYI